MPDLLSKFKRIATEVEKGFLEKGKPSVGCPLCTNEEISFRYHDDDICWAAINPTSQVPIVVLKAHKAIPSPEEQQHMLRILDHIMQAHSHEIGSYSYSDPTTIPDHYHIQGGKHELTGF